MTMEAPSMYKVFYKLSDTKKQEVVDYFADGLYDLRKQLSTDGITYTRCDFLYVHQHLPGGAVQEVIAYERARDTQGPVERPSAIVVPFTAKPRVKLQHNATTSPTKKVISSMFFTAEEA